MKPLPAINLKSIEKIYKILPHHEVYPLVLRIKLKSGEESIDIDGDNHGDQAVEMVELWLKSQGFEIETVDLSDENIEFAEER